MVRFVLAAAVGIAAQFVAANQAAAAIPCPASKSTPVYYELSWRPVYHKYRQPSVAGYEYAERRGSANTAARYTSMFGI